LLCRKGLFPAGGREGEAPAESLEADLGPDANASDAERTAAVKK
jgi:hypothetical protein